MNEQTTPKQESSEQVSSNSSSDPSRSEQPSEQPITGLAAALIALAGDEAAITPNDPRVLEQLHKPFAARTRAEFRSQAADRLEALREWIDRSLRYHVVRLRYDPLEEEPTVSYSYATQDVLSGAAKLTDLVLEAHEEDVVLRTIVMRDVTEKGKSLSTDTSAIPSGVSLEYAAKQGYDPTVAEAASYYGRIIGTGFVPGEEVMA